MTRIRDKDNPEMMSSEQLKHCDHECVCRYFMDFEKPCRNPHPLSSICEFDTRSRPHPAPRPPCEECIYQAQAADRARKAREDVLDKIMWYMVNHGVEKRPEGYYVISGTFSLGGFIKHIESLRSTQQQAGDP